MRRIMRLKSRGTEFIDVIEDKGCYIVKNQLGEITLKRKIDDEEGAVAIAQLLSGLQNKYDWKEEISCTRRFWSKICKGCKFCKREIDQD